MITLWLTVLIVLIYFGLSVGYLLVLTLAGKYRYRNPWTDESSKPSIYRRIAVLVPAYKEDGIIMATAQNLLDQEYPAICFDVHVIADSLQRDTLEQLRTLPLTVWEVSFRQSTKARSLNAFFARNRQSYDLVLICDADKLADPTFLEKINRAFDLGARAVQGRRVAKNMDTAYAFLDACSEAINNHIFRRGASALGLSSSVIGSGMAFEYNMLKEVLASIDAVGGFDKPLQLNIVAKGIDIRYVEDAVIFDEKIESAKAFGNQRRRWLSSQWVYLRRFFLPGWAQLFRGQRLLFQPGGRSATSSCPGPCSWACCPSSPWAPFSWIPGWEPWRVLSCWLDVSHHPAPWPCPGRTMVRTSPRHWSNYPARSEGWPLICCNCAARTKRLSTPCIRERVLPITF